MYTQNDIKIMALKELGREDAPDFLDSNAPDIQNINLQYDLLYTYALSRFNWSFAKEWAALREPAEVPGKYRYRFELPEDFVYLRAVYEDEKFQANTTDYEIVKNVIYANVPTVSIEYTTRLDEQDLPPFFVEWFKFRLALALCTNTNGDSDLLQFLSQREAFEYMNAINTDTRQKGGRVLNTGAFIDCR